MSGRRRIAGAGKRPTGTSHSRTEPGRHIASPPVADVMLDQLQYLAAHAVRGCLCGCAACARLAQVKDLLLLPFLSDMRPDTPGQRASGQADE
jgi:hypothetical protein